MAEEQDPKGGNPDPGQNQDGNDNAADNKKADGNAGDKKEEKEGGEDRIDFGEIGNLTKAEVLDLISAKHTLTQQEQILKDKLKEVTEREETLNSVYESNKPFIDLLQSKPELAKAIADGDEAAIRRAFSPTSAFAAHLEKLRAEGDPNFEPMNGLFQELSRASGETQSLRGELASTKAALGEMRNLELIRQLSETKRRFELMGKGDKFNAEEVFKAASASREPLTPNTVWNVAQKMHLSLVLEAEREKGKKEGAAKKEAADGMRTVDGKQEPTKETPAAPKTRAERTQSILKQVFALRQAKK